MNNLEIQCWEIRRNEYGIRTPLKTLCSRFINIGNCIFEWSYCNRRLYRHEPGVTMHGGEFIFISYYWLKTRASILLYFWFAFNIWLLLLSQHVLTACQEAGKCGRCTKELLVLCSLWICFTIFNLLILMAVLKAFESFDFTSFDYNSLIALILFHPVSLENIDSF